MAEKIKRKKNTICATVSPYTKRQVDALVEAGDFSSMSDLVNVALTEFLVKYESLKKKEAAPKDVPTCIEHVYE
ncbi:hypothetical protein [Methanolobus halotolerans]|uniref:CopG family transcriptional regulator n=1 Tax=Methanolobus halotolerans TaxID=2052935 RepID=A0A4E0QXM0_9EURY|nr:hypothetical protein [Methanolobus halotolerans]TGC08014.1 hypothetical protein CUN85_10250 [Methanolobus halotolerans]